jgi:hypothetical protein
MENRVSVAIVLVAAVWCYPGCQHALRVLTSCLQHVIGVGALLLSYVTW